MAVNTNCNVPKIYDKKGLKYESKYEKLKQKAKIMVKIHCKIKI